MQNTMTYQIDIQNEKPYPVNAARLQQAVQMVLESHEIVAESGLTIVITSNDQVASLNRQYRGIDAPTDVLSFPADQPLLPGEAPYLGDLVIAYPYALAQAEREGHYADDSFCLLVVHGTLHLLGYDHDTPENRVAMWTVQADMLNRLGISPAIVPALEGSNHGIEAG